MSNILKRIGAHLTDMETEALLSASKWQRTHKMRVRENLVGLVKYPVKYEHEDGHEVVGILFKLTILVNQTRVLGQLACGEHLIVVFILRATTQRQRCSFD